MNAEAKGAGSSPDLQSSNSPLSPAFGKRE